MKHDSDECYSSWWCPSLAVSILHYYQFNNIKIRNNEFQMEWNIYNETETVNICLPKMTKLKSLRCFRHKCIISKQKPLFLWAHSLHNNVGYNNRTMTQTTSLMGQDNKHTPSSLFLFNFLSLLRFRCSVFQQCSFCDITEDVLRRFVPFIVKCWFIVDKFPCCTVDFYDSFRFLSIYSWVLCVVNAFTSFPLKHP